MSPAASTTAPRPWCSSSDVALQWLLSPTDVGHFFSDVWERRPLHLQRKNPDRYAGLLSQAEIEAQLRSPGLVFGQDINVARCAEDGSQIMCNGQGRADPKKIARQVADGCSVQVVHPQRFAAPVAELLKRLEAHFGCLWGANSFRTPPGSMGFKAHHDEVEVFMLQLEGAKRWRLHRCPSGPLPRSYCWDYKEEELGPPLMELTLEAGDLLYLPRGTVHKGIAVEGRPSHHLTISTYQRFCWADFLEKALPAALEAAVAAESRYRRGLPLRCLGTLGCQYRPLGSACGNTERQACISELRGLLAGLADHAAAAADVARGLGSVGLRKSNPGKRWLDF